MNVKSNILTFVNSICIVGIIIAFVFFNMEAKKSKIAYIDNIKVFNSFKMTDDIGVQNKNRFQAQAHELDSIVEVLKKMEKEITTAKKVSDKTQETYSVELQKFRNKEAIFLQEKEKVNAESTNQIWGRINALVKTYGEENGYEIIFGTQGNGNIMYGKEALDVTADFTLFANQKYEGN
ncbi:OmpH family outer membrane protein [Aureivirga marina]|uniref:OmpH family outer membrane protein n=1 Tax=Aureivirga marina TaxID=1182451 RepID=UPI0018CBB66D|nr:OmpH family outer membrane protein [Aureivirga marina]